METETKNNSTEELLIQKDGILRLSREAKSQEIRKAELDGEPIYVMADSWNNEKEQNVLFIHGNKKNKKVYRTHRTKIVLTGSGKKVGNFADFIDEKIKEKLLKKEEA